MTSSTLHNVIVKLGTSSLTNADGVIDIETIERVATELAALRTEGHRITVVSSGAIAAGLPALGMVAGDRPTEAVALQAISSIGQTQLMETWRRAFVQWDLVIGQILLAPHNFGERSQYLHARSTLDKLHELGVIPIVNENDAVTDAEIRYGDNDRIAALVANMVEADTLLLLTDTDGVLTEDPNVNPDASLIEEIRDFDGLGDSNIGGPGTVRGSGGMASKLTAAKIASRSGVRTVIASAAREGVVADAVHGVSGVGTVVPPQGEPMPARKLWIGFAMPVSGRFVVDAGAHAALAAGGRSLLAVGVTASEGGFERRDAVEIVDPSGTPFARGLARVAHSELGDTSEGDVLVHADDLVVI